MTTDKAEPMIDGELARSLNLTAEEAAIVIPKLTPSTRRQYENLIRTADELVLWQQGVCPMPACFVREQE